MRPFSVSEKLRLFTLILCIIGFLAIFWSQALHVPYWQDDYYFLLDAQQARLSGEPWYVAFFPAEKTNFWRPLGMETYWRFVEGVLGGHAQAAHVVNILLLIAAALAVGWLATALVKLKFPYSDVGATFCFTTLLYGVHAAHFLPAAWASAANNSIAMIFSALALRYWLVVSTGSGRQPIYAVPPLAVCFILALLSRDIAFVLPALGLLMTLWLRPGNKPTTTTWAAGVLCVGIAVGWLLLRNHFTYASDPAYELKIGYNLLRNTGALALFAFNVPFEALRFFFFVEPSWKIVAWGMLSFALQAAAFVLLLHAARERLKGKGLFVLAAFFAAGCGPAFFFSVNCYPYYTTLGLIAYAILAGLAAHRTSLISFVLLLVVFSSTNATLGNFFLDFPSHIGRARWAEQQLLRLKAIREVRPELFVTPLVVAVEDEHRYLGFRAEGLAYRLGIQLAEIELRDAQDAVSEERPVLVVPLEGDVSFRMAGDGL